MCGVDKCDPEVIEKYVQQYLKHIEGKKSNKNIKIYYWFYKYNHIVCIVVVNEPRK